ncbi:hypothetical protein lerEdw1_004154 [Lerista edwardsae]|nr:hypothetical protein lerEdw1_004154 [Lerista edwardsae]
MEQPGAESDAEPLAGPDPELAATMGFSGFGKKARTFDFNAMFEQTRRTAVERSRKILEEREKEASEKEKESGSPCEGLETRAALSHPVARIPSSNSSSSNSEDSSDEGLIGPPLPPQGSVEDSDDELIGPPLPPGYKDSDDDEDDDMQEEDEASDSMAEQYSTDLDILNPPHNGIWITILDEELMPMDEIEVPLSQKEGGNRDPVKKIPDSHEITLHHGTKTVSALGLDPSGARLITGGYDYDVRFWDFAGMDASLQAFRSLQPCECHQIKSLQYSSTGDVILVVAGNSQAKVLDRDGFPVMECVKGDQYIVDMANTKWLLRSESRVVPV